ncbi:MAG TPA: hypothetical protein VIL56_03370 [Gaiellaceae bacterium]|jgi:hypothetical protein
MLERLRISRPAFAAIVVLAFISLSGTAVAAGVVPLAKRALFAVNAGKLQGKTAVQVAAMPGPATDSPTVAGQTPEQIAALAGPASTAAGLIAYRTAAFSLSPGQASDLTVSCTSGERVVSGGYSTPNLVFRFDSFPTSDGAAWQMYLVNPSSSQSASGTMYAVCLK